MKQPGNDTTNQGIKHFFRYFFVLVGIIILRMFLETFADRDPQQVFMVIEDWSTNLSHFLPSFLLIFILIALAIYAVVGTNFHRAWKFVALSSPIILIAPLVDIIASGGKGADLAYVFPKQVDAISVFSSLFSSAVTVGLRTELILILLGLGTYTLYVSRKVWKAILASFLGYLILLFYAFFPLVLKNINDLLGFSADRFFEKNRIFSQIRSFDFNVGIFYFLLVLLGIFIIFLIIYRRQALLIIKNSRPLRGTIYYIMIGIGLLIAAKIFPLTSFNLYSLAILVALFLSIITAWMQAALVNDIFDQQTDISTNPDRALVKNEISIANYKMAAAILIVISLISALYVNYYVAWCVGIFMILTFLYSCPPYRLKKIPLLSNFIIGIAALLSTLAGFIVIARYGSFEQFPIVFVPIILIVVTLVSVVKDLKDIKGDKLTGVHTLPGMIAHQLGETSAYHLTGAIVAIAFLLIPFLLGYLSTSPLTIVTIIFAILLYLLIAEFRIKDQYILMAVYVYIVILGILITPVFLSN